MYTVENTAHHHQHKTDIVGIFSKRMKNGFIIEYNLYPNQRHRKDVSNFDRQFTSEGTELTPTDKLFMMNLDQVVMLDMC